MNRRQLGKTGIQVSEMGLGTWQISGGVWGAKDDAVSIRALHTAADGGVNFFDTAAGYSKGHSEELLGKFLVERRATGEEIIVSTKVPPECSVFAPPPERQIADFYRPEWIRQQCETSLRRLQRDYIDILLIHTWSPSWGHETAWFEEMMSLKAQGKIRAIGISIPDEGIADANVPVAMGRVDVIQCVYNICQQEPEHTLFPLTARHGVGIIARSPLSSGALIGNWTKTMTFPQNDWRGMWPKNIKANWLEEQVDMADRVKEVLAGAGLALPDAALRFVLDNPHVSSVIPGSANPAHIQKNLDALKQPSLPAETAAALRTLWTEGKVHGTYNGSVTANQGSHRRG